MPAVLATYIDFGLKCGIQAFFPLFEGELEVFYWIRGYSCIVIYLNLGMFFIPSMKSATGVARSHNVSSMVRLHTHGVFSGIGGITLD